MVIPICNGLINGLCIQVAKSNPTFFQEEPLAAWEECRIPEALSDVPISSLRLFSYICFFASSNLAAFHQQLLKGFVEQPFS